MNRSYWSRKLLYLCNLNFGTSEFLYTESGQSHGVYQDNYAEYMRGKIDGFASTEYEDESDEHGADMDLIQMILHQRMKMHLQQELPIPTTAIVGTAPPVDNNTTNAM